MLTITPPMRLYQVQNSVILQICANKNYFYFHWQPIHLINYSLEIAKAGKLPSGKTEIPFEVPLKPKGNKTLYETYHGVFINVQVKSYAFLIGL